MLKILVTNIIILVVLYHSIIAENIIWADRVLNISSQVSQTIFSAQQVIGEPSVSSHFGLSPCAWMPDFIKNNINEEITVAFKESINAEQVIINENNIKGGIQQIFLIDSLDNRYLIYESLNNFEVKNSDSGKTFQFRFQRTTYKVYGLKIILKKINRNIQYQIDAIGITDSAFNYKIDINLFQSDFKFTDKENLGTKINSVNYELSPVISGDGKIFYFTRDNFPLNMGTEKKQDIWYCKINEAFNLTDPVNIGQPINNDYNNIIFATSPDGNTIYLTNQYLPDGKMSKGLSFSRRNGINWDTPININVKNFYNRNKYAEYCLSYSGKVLIMSIERDDSYGGQDLYISTLMDDGEWTEPMNLGPRINTGDNEQSPFLAADDKTLFFSSAGFPGYGNNDIFRSVRLDSTWYNWEKPMNLGESVNSKRWDAFFTIPALGDFAYFVSQEGSIGQTDIFRIKIPQILKPYPTVLVSGRVINSKTKLPVSAKIFYERLPEGKELGIAQSDPVSGEYKIILPTGSKYGFLAEAKGFIAINENINLIDLNSTKELNRDLYLVPIELNQSVRINNIFFEFGKYDLLSESYPELNRILKFLTDNPEIQIQIDGHTDNIGEISNNMILSQYRADAVKDYLLQKGVSINRMVSRGYGESKPISSNSNDEGRQKNRRVEFRIIK